MPSPAPEAGPVRLPHPGVTPRPGPRLAPVLVEPPRVADGAAGAEGRGEPPAPGEGDARPRLGVVAVPVAPRAGAGRRQGPPTVRAVRLADGPAAPGERHAAPAAVTPVPLPVPRAVPTTTPTESRTEEPQP
ncbi:hypothetical protein ACIRQY_26940 [Streptomyces sp. NPDC101490]|uniref:hypothetical protein n=1 Tax=Streptomyces sp. NPDC101490 TaxID=3366143 RepID=UPI0037FCCA7E